MDICITGASQNTLRHISLTLPAGKLIALMGPSGSGKSTLAYDTLFAESRRRFLDCLSAGARRLLARPEKPHVESIEGLPPALCLEQHLPQGQSRTVLGSLTETLDYLRILYAAIGVPHDPVTGERLTRLSPEDSPTACWSCRRIRA
ncbi:MAG: ATP-binding cassette domain-containing protein [Akkermansia sp.]|nr:ATP-binding cassette domain-containing protein [Akkermansia sp.]